MRRDFGTEVMAVWFITAAVVVFALIWTSSVFSLLAMICPHRAAFPAVCDGDDDTPDEEDAPR